MNIVYLAPAAFDDLKQRPQYMAEYLAKRHKVIYVEPTLKWVSHLKNRRIEYGKVRRKINRNLAVVRCSGLFVPPFHWNLFDPAGINGISEMLQLKKIIRRADIVIAGFEGWYPIIRWLKIPRLVYDKMDDNALLVKNVFDKKYLRRAEKKLLEKTDLVVVTAGLFLKRYQALGKKTVLIPNGVELPDKGPIPNGVKLPDTQIGKEHQKKIYGYVGMIAAWLDMDIVELIAETAGCEVWLVGPRYIPESRKENIKYFGTVPKEQVWEYIRRFDVCLYPFKRDKLTDTVNPIKLYEYLALNKPVIASDSIETRKFGGLVCRYAAGRDVLKLCGQKLERPFQTEAARLRFVKENSWESRVKKTERILEKMI